MESHPLRAGLWTFLILLFGASPGLAQGDAPAESPSLFHRTATGFRRLGDVDGSALLLTGATLAYLSARGEDPERSARAIDRSFLEGGVDTGDFYGGGLTVGLGGAGLVLAGELGAPALGDAGRDVLASFAVASVGTWALKLSVGRERPSGGPHSFPSGHSAVAFSTVPIAFAHGGRWMGLAATALAVGTGAARMEDQRHYLSDVVFGAAIGLAAGHAVVGDSVPWRALKDRVAISGRGLGIRLRF